MCLKHSYSWFKVLNRIKYNKVVLLQRALNNLNILNTFPIYGKVKVGNDLEKSQSERNFQFIERLKYAMT